MVVFTFILYNMEKTLIEFQIYLNDKGLIKLINNLAIACNCCYKL